MLAEFDPEFGPIFKCLVFLYTKMGSKTGSLGATLTLTLFLDMSGTLLDILGHVCHRFGICFLKYNFV